MRFVASHESERVGWVYIIISCKLSDYHRCHSFLRALEANISLLEVRTKTLLFSVMNIIQMNLDVIGGLPDAEVIMQAQRVSTEAEYSRGKDVVNTYIFHQYSIVR